LSAASSPIYLFKVTLAYLVKVLFDSVLFRDPLFTLSISKTINGSSPAFVDDMRHTFKCQLRGAANGSQIRSSSSFAITNSGVLFFIHRFSFSICHAHAVSIYPNPSPNRDPCNAALWKLALGTQKQILMAFGKYFIVYIIYSVYVKKTEI